MLRRKAMRRITGFLPFYAYVALLAPGLGALHPDLARAQDVAGTSEGPSLSHFTTQERASLQPLLARGPVALVEFSEGEALPGIVFAANVNASAEEVARVIADPARYPHFMDALDSVVITGHLEQTVSYDWTWHTAMFEMRGSYQMTAYSPPPGHPERGYRFAVQSLSGDLGRGRFVWRIYPTSAHECLLSLAMRVDLRDANYIAREMSEASRSVNRAVNISLVSLMVLGTRREAERLAHAPPRAASPAAGGPTFLGFDVRSLASLLRRGDVISLQMNGDELAQVTSMGRMGAPVARVRSVIHDPHAFGATLIPGSSVEVLSSDNGRQVFEWSIALPLVGSSGTMALYDSADDVLVDGLSGSLHAGRWRFSTPVIDDNGESGLVATGIFDVSDTSFLIRALVGSNRDFGVGLAAASQLMVARAIRNQAVARERSAQR
ncbi:MAG: SRPBCC family protein [Sandaracinaceae bacterium]|nr:SRPBCC family protein [Sandaracinaceae bacterium]